MTKNDETCEHGVSINDEEGCEKCDGLRNDDLGLCPHGVDLEQNKCHDCDSANLKYEGQI